MNDAATSDRTRNLPTPVKTARNGAVLDFWLSGTRQKEIAERFDITPARVLTIVKRTLARNGVPLCERARGGVEIDEARYRRGMNNAEFMAVARFIHDAAWGPEEGVWRRRDAHFVWQWNRFSDWLRE